MDRLQTAIAALHEVDRESSTYGVGSRVHPLARLIVCMGFLLTTVSFAPYDLAGLLSMSIYLFITGIWEEIPIRKSLSGLRYLFVPVCFLGLANLIYDKDVIYYLGSVPITGGMLSAFTLFGKGVFSIMAAFFLLRLIGMQGLCRALLRLGIPGGAVTVLLLTWRYLIVLLKEIRRMWQAYTLRAPGHRGIHTGAWGSFAGLLLLRSMDRAADVYHSMLLRGYDGTSIREGTESRAETGISILYTIIWLGVFLLLRSIPLFHLVGSWLGGFM